VEHTLHGAILLEFKSVPLSEEEEEEEEHRGSERFVLSSNWDNVGLACVLFRLSENSSSRLHGEQSRQMMSAVEWTCNRDNEIGALRASGSAGRPTMRVTLAFNSIANAQRLWTSVVSTYKRTKFVNAHTALPRKWNYRNVSRSRLNWSAHKSCIGIRSIILVSYTAERVKHRSGVRRLSVPSSSGSPGAAQGQLGGPDLPKESGNFGGISCPIVKYRGRGYPACLFGQPYSQTYSVGGSSDAAFRCQ